MSIFNFSFTETLLREPFGRPRRFIFLSPLLNAIATPVMKINAGGPVEEPELRTSLSSPATEGKEKPRKEKRGETGL